LKLSEKITFDAFCPSADYGKHKEKTIKNKNSTTGQVIFAKQQRIGTMEIYPFCVLPLSINP
jgi:hypothetical protein